MISFPVGKDFLNPLDAEFTWEMKLCRLIMESHCRYYNVWMRHEPAGLVTRLPLEGAWQWTQPWHIVITTISTTPCGVWDPDLRWELFTFDIMMLILQFLFHVDGKDFLLFLADFNDARKWLRMAFCVCRAVARKFQYRSVQSLVTSKVGEKGFGKYCSKSMILSNYKHQWGSLFSLLCLSVWLHDCCRKWEGSDLKLRLTKPVGWLLSLQLTVLIRSGIVV